MALTTFKTNPVLGGPFIHRIERDNHQEWYNDLITTSLRSMMWRQVKDNLINEGPHALPFGDSTEASGLEVEFTDMPTPTHVDGLFYVFDDDTEEPIEGAEVELDGVDTITTSSNGRALFDKLEVEETYVMTVTCTGYEDIIGADILIEYDNYPVTKVDVGMVEL